MGISFKCYIISLLIFFKSVSSKLYNGWGWDYPSSSKQIADETCEIILTTLNTTKYNLCPLKLLTLSQIPYYNTFDVRLNKSFAFNILSPTIQVPKPCQSNSNTNAYAYLYDNTECIQLSGETPVISLLNIHNPSDGIVLSYQSTEKSSVCNNGKRLNLRFVCDNEGIVDIPKITISEIDYYGSQPDNINNQCQYNLTFNSVYGCPHSCPIYNKKVCNNYGLCGYDSIEHNQPKCYCFSNIGGIACEIYGEQNNIFIPQNTEYKYNLSSIGVHQFTIDKTSFDGKIYSLDVTYDLTNFTNVLKINDLDGTMYDYYFGRVPQQFGDICADKINKGLIFQIDETNMECVVAGGYNITWNLYDISNGAKGVSISFDGGDYCDKDGTLRSFKVNFICPDDDNTYYLPNKTIHTFVEEDSWDTCSYHMDFISAYACPKECISKPMTVLEDNTGITVCSTNGMCMADMFSGYVHCKCDGPPHLVWNDDVCSSNNNAIGPDPKGANGGNKSTDNMLYIVVIAIISTAFILFQTVCCILFFKQRKQISQLNNLSNAVNYEKPMLQEVIEVPVDNGDDVETGTR
eukprot:230255_1